MPTSDIELLKEKVKAINEKYGIKKRWRAKMEGEYFYIDDYCKISIDKDRGYSEDEARYRFGNYFETKEEALEYAEYMKKCSLEWHEKRDRDE